MEEPLLLWDAASNNKTFTAELKTNTRPVLPVGGLGRTTAGTARMQAQISVKTSWTNQADSQCAGVCECATGVLGNPSIIALPPSPAHRGADVVGDDPEPQLQAR